LTGEDFFVRTKQIEPFRAVDFWKGLQTSALGRPLYLERVASDGADIDIALDDEGVNAFATTLTDFPPTDEVAVRERCQVLP
jgi:hypothetical protein